MMNKQTNNNGVLPKRNLFKRLLVTTGLLLWFSYGVTAQTNTLYGVDALKNNTSGTWNNALGYQALIYNTTGYYNTASGALALFSNTIGYYNTANGSQTLHENTEGHENTASGLNALFFNTKGSYNTANGCYALLKNTSGIQNTATGFQALLSNTTGNYNTASGLHALYYNTTGNNNTALGFFADVASANLNNATAIGANAKVTTSNTIQLGDNAVTKVFAGVGNTATLIAGSLQVTGGSPAAGKILTSDASGTATWQAPASTGWSLTGTAGTIDGTNFIGTTDNIPFNIRVNNEKAGKIDHLKSNTFYGYQSANVTTSNYNTAIGSEALYVNTTGGDNTANGFRALYNNTTGGNNTAIGSEALYGNTTGENNTALGSDANVSAGNLDNATAIGSGAIVKASNTIMLGNVTVTDVFSNGNFKTTSDGRFKTNISETDVKGLAFIKKLRPVVYNFDTKKFQAFLTKNMPDDIRKKYMDKDFSSSTAIRQSGFIAQEVEKAAQEIGYDFNGIHKPESDDDNYSLAYSQFVVPLVKGMQEQQKQIEEQKQEIKDQQKINQQLQQQIDELKKLIVGNSSLTKDVVNKEVGIADSEDITLYPNPTTGICTITASNINNGVIEIYDMAGNNMQKTTFNNAKAGYQLNVSGYAKGVYLLNIIANNKKYTKRLVIQ